MRQPPKVMPANASPQARALRLAAKEWGDHVEDDGVGEYDLPSHKRNKALLKAAIAYAEVAVGNQWVEAARKSLETRWSDVAPLEASDDLLVLVQKYDKANPPEPDHD